MNKPYDKQIEDLNNEIVRVKIWANESGYRADSALGVVIRRYRNELKDLREILVLNNE